MPTYTASPRPSPGEREGSPHCLQILTAWNKSCCIGERRPLPAKVAGERAWNFNAKDRRATDRARTSCSTRGYGAAFVWFVSRSGQVQPGRQDLQRWCTNHPEAGIPGSVLGLVWVPPGVLPGWLLARSWTQKAWKHAEKPMFHARRKKPAGNRPICTNCRLPGPRALGHPACWPVGLQCPKLYERWLNPDYSSHRRSESTMHRHKP